jgi:hypothetical protein
VDDVTDVVEQARELLEGVTPGPWEASDDSRDEITVGAGSYLENPGSYNPGDLIVEYDVYSDEEAEREQRWRDARFIAGARQLIPDLVETIEQLRTQLGVAPSDAGQR